MIVGLIIKGQMILEQIVVGRKVLGQTNVRRLTYPITKVSPYRTS